MSSFTRLGAGVSLAAAGGYIVWSRKRQQQVVVIGGGVIGLNTAACLAREGRRVVLIDANHPIRGSWGVSRASHLRVEDPVLFRMAAFSIPQWLKLQEDYTATCGGYNDTFFYKKTGALMGGPVNVIEAMAAKIRDFNVPEAKLEVLDSIETAARFPQVRLDEDEKALYQTEGYTMLVPTCLECLRWDAERAGVQLEEDSVTQIDRHSRVVTTESGSKFEFSDLVVTAGPWTNQIFASAGLSGVPLIVSNEQTVEVLPKHGAPSHSWDALPIFSWSEAGYKGLTKDGGCRYFYTVPHVPLEGSGSMGMKIGMHRQGALLDTNEFLVTPSGRDLKKKLPHLRKEFREEQAFEFDEFLWRHTQEFLRAKFPGIDAEGQPAGYMRCLYQMTPDMQMIVGKHPEDDSVVFACGFSGSGFQFSPAIGDMLAALVTRGKLSGLHEAMAAKFDPRRFET